MTQRLNELGAGAVSTGLVMLLQTTILLAVLLACDVVLRNRARATLRYALWLLFVLKLCLPPSLTFPTGVGFWAGRWLAAPQPASTTRFTVTDRPAPRQTMLSPTSPGPAQAAPISQPALSPQAWLMLLWAAGAGVMAGWVAHKHRLLRQWRRRSTPAPAATQDCVRKLAFRLGLSRPPEVVLTPGGHSPAITGAWHPVILLPASLAQALPPAALRDVLWHELIHLRRGDLWTGLAQTLVQIAWWWNPLVWIANQRIRTLREHAVDEAVMVLAAESRATYATTLVEVARLCTDPLALTPGFTGIVESRGILRTRIMRLVQGPLPHQAHLGWSGWLVVLLAAFLGLPMAFTRRVEAQNAPEPAASPAPQRVTNSAGPVSPQNLTMSEALRRRYGLDAPAAAASSNQVSEAEFKRLHPGLSDAMARRYGLFPTNATNAPQNSNRRPKAPPGMNPAMAARYGLALDPASTNAPAAQPSAPTAPVMDPKLAKRYGLAPGTSAPAMDPAMAARYGLTRPQQPTTPATALTAQPAQPSQPAHATEPLVTRTYRVDLRALQQSLQTTANPVGSTGSRAETENALRAFFHTAGVEFPTAASDPAASQTPAANQRSLFFNENNGLLMVRANAAEHEVIAQATEALQTTPAQVVIEARFVEVTQSDGTLGTLFLQPGDKPAAPVGALKSSPPTASSGQPATVTGILTDPQFKAVVQALGHQTNSSEAPATPATLSGILTDPQFRTVLQALERKSGTSVLAAPRVLTLSGRQAQIQTIEMRSVYDPVSHTTNQIPIGPVLDVIPHVTADGKNIELTILATLTELIGKPSGPSDKPMPASALRTQQLSTHALVRDGQTIVLGNVLPSEGANAKKSSQRNLLVFITPTIVDPAGNRVNPEAK